LCNAIDYGVGMGNFLDENTPSEYEQLAEDFEQETDAFLEEMDDEYEDEDEYDDEDEDEFQSENAAYSLNNHENEVLTNATVRLEQARLYDMLIKHDMFDGVDANQAALKNVKKEMKGFIVERLEILLGIKSEKVIDNSPKQVVVESDFNDVEVEALKAIAYKLTKGKSAGQPNRKMVASETSQQTEPRREGLKPMGVKLPNKGLKPMAKKVSIRESEPEEEEVVQKKPVSKKKKIPVAKKAKSKKVKKNVSTGKPIKSITRKTRSEKMSDAEAEAIAREDMELNGTGMKKHPYQMNAKELAALMKSKGKVKAKPRPSNAAPMPSSDQLSMHYQTQQMNSGFGGNDKQKLVNTLVQNAVKKANNS